MGRFSHITRARQPADPHSTRRFVLLLTLVLVFGVIYRGRQVAMQMQHFIEDKIFQPNLQLQIQTAQNNSTTLIPQLDANMSAATTDDTGPASYEKISEDPCLGRPQPQPVPGNITKPPSLYFLHIPKTAGTLMHHILIRYASKTNGLACQYLYDGNRFGPGDYFLSTKPPPRYPNGSIEQDAVDAINARNAPRKLQLLMNGACRTMRGHVTYKQREYMRQPIISLTVLRDPHERFVSMYEFAMMMVRSRPGKSGWDNLISGDLEADFRNSSTILHQGFYDDNGKWIALRNVGFSFHLYGVLHQLSGINPVFEGVGTPEKFRISNADELAEKAKDNICSTHILGTQSNMDATLDLFFKTVTLYSNWTDQELKDAKSILVNRNIHKKKAIEDSWSKTMREAMQRRFEHETDVYNFALKVIAYRKQLAERQ